MHHIRILSIILFALVFSLSSPAQKKEISAAKDQVKKGQNLAGAEASMLKLLENPDNRGNAKIYRVLNSAIQKQYLQLNEKMYLKQEVDTAALFTTLNKAFSYALRTYEALPKEGEENKPFLDKYISNILTGGLFLFKKEKYADAYNLLDTYIACSGNALFADSPIAADSSSIVRASYRALCSGYKLSDLNKTVRHRDKALLFKPGKIVALKYLAETLQRQDSTYSQYINTLKDGFREFPCDEYFFSRLLNHLLSNQRIEEALDVAQAATRQCPDNATYHNAEAHILLNAERYEDCIIAADNVIELADSISEAYYIAGMANVYLAQTYSQRTIRDKEAKKRMLAYYSAAMPYLETYRRREPKRKDKWGSPLYSIYLNLNKGKEFDEISKILR